VLEGRIVKPARSLLPPDIAHRRHFPWGGSFGRPYT
jgi:hypothetical protein